MITGIDLIEQQIKGALTVTYFTIKQKDIKFNGHAIECRINAEILDQCCLHQGLITDYHAAAGPGIRVDSHLYSGYRVPHQCDSLIAKVIAHGNDRHHVIKELNMLYRDDYPEGVSTNTSLHQDILNDPRFESEDISIPSYKNF